MTMPSPAQLWSVVRQLIPIIGTILTMFGIIPESVSDQWTQQLLAVGGPIVIFIGFVLSFRQHAPTAVIKETAALPQTRVERTPDGGVVVWINDAALASKALETQAKVDAK